MIKIFHINKLIPAVFLLAGLLIFLSGCSSINTAIKYKDLEVQSTMSDSIFVEPVAPYERKIYIDIRNSSKEKLDIKQQVFAQIAPHGYMITNDPTDATYWLQVNILSVAENSKTALEASRGGGFGSTILGAAAGAGIGHAIGGRKGTGAGALTGALIFQAGDAIIGNMNKVRTFAIIADIQVSERVKGIVDTSQNSKTRSGSSTTKTQKYKSKTDMLIHRTRIVTYATKNNLKFNEALPVIQNALVQQISGIF